MAELWQRALQRTAQFNAQALDYDYYRPRYPQACFDDLVETAGLKPGDEVVEVGSGTGIATAPLVEAGLKMTAIEPGADMAAIAKAKLAGRCIFFDGRFDDWSPTASVSLVVALNAWHWVEPSRGLELAARALVPGGTIAMAWTEVVSWGSDPFAGLLAETTGGPWPIGPLAECVASIEPLRADARFRPVEVHRHRFERVLDAANFVAVTRTYGGGYEADTYRAGWALGRGIPVLMVRLGEDPVGFRAKIQGPSTPGDTASGVASTIAAWLTKHSDFGEHVTNQLVDDLRNARSF